MKKTKEINSISEFEELKFLTTNNTELIYDYNYNNIIFNIELNLKEKVKKVSFENCVFNKKVNLSLEVIENASFSNSIFENDVNFSNTLFNKKARFYQCNFKGSVNFNNTRFHDLADFWNAKFFKKTIFYKTDFHGITVFSSTQFSKNVLFTYTLFDKVVIFRDTKFKQGIDLSLAILSGTINIYNIELSDFEHVKDIRDVHEFDKAVSSNGNIPLKNKRETYRIIKTQLNQSQNHIDALYYSNLEIKTYSKQLSQEIRSIDGFLRTWESYIILKLNWLSNNNGTSWSQGVFFTLIVGAIFFYLSLLATENYVFSLSNIEFDKSFKYYIMSLLPTHNIGYMESEKPNSFFYMWDFIGRIFVSYGIFQTIQAFRKLKHK